MRFTRKLGWLWILLALLTAPRLLHGQSIIKAGTKDNVYARALELNQQALELYSEPGRAADAARLHLSEVKLRSQRDPEAIESLAMAAHLLNYANRPLQARKVMEQAGDRAIAIGHVARAAQAYIDAAFLAEKRNNKQELQRLGWKAVLLSESPLLRPDQKSAIRDRLQSNPTLAALLKP